MSITLPSKRFLIGLGTAVGLIVITLGVIEGVEIIKKRRAQKQEEKQQIIRDLVVLRSQQGLDVLSLQDTDSDGLPDWKEALWQLDPKNPDTDGNGVNDGEQIKLIEQDLQKKSGITDQKELKPVDQIARDIYTAVTVLKQSGQLTPENTEALINQINTSMVESVEVPSHTQSELVVVPSTEQNKTRYIQELKKILLDVVPGDIKMISESAVVTNPEDVNPEVIAEIVRKYKTINQKLLKLSVPANYTETHLEFLNTMEVLYSNISGIAASKEDPMAGLVGTVQIPETLSKLANITLE